jgi:glycosyltransferase involved in cell wall biosynthesis
MEERAIARFPDYERQHRLSRLVSAPLFPAFLLAFALLAPIARLRAARARRARRRPRVLWGTSAMLLLKHNSRSVREVGYESDTVVFSTFPLAQRADYDYAPGSSLPAWLKPLALRYLVFLWAVWRYDIFQLYHSGRLLHGTVAEFLELQLLRAAGKKSVAASYGGDIWLPGLTRDPNRWDEVYLLPQRPYLADPWFRSYIERNIAYCARHADWVIVSFPFHDYLPRWDTLYHLAAIDTAEWAFVGVDDHPGPVRVVHASNHRRLKGTQCLIEACERLAAAGLPIELTLVEGVSNVDARRLYEQADVVAAEFVMGLFGLFGMEAMALGKPVLAYVRADAVEHGRYFVDSPVVNTPPEKLEENLRRLATDPALRRRLGEQGRAFVERYNSYRAIGGFYDRLYRHLWWGAERPTLPS